MMIGSLLSYIGQLCSMCGCDKMEKEVIPLLRNIVFTFLLIIGALFLFIASIPLFNAYPYSDGPNSGPSSTWDLIRMISYQSWALFLIIGLVFLISSVLGLRKRFLLNNFLR